MLDRPLYTIIAGVDGVGKSSLTGVLKTERTDLGMIIDADKIAADTQGRAYTAGKTALAKIEDCLSRGLSFTQETTLSGHHIQKTAQRAKARGYHIRLFYIGLENDAESIKRIKNRVEKGGHHIPDSDVTRRFAKRFTDLAEILPYCDQARLFDNENGFVEVAEYRNGEIITKGDYKPQWLEELRTVQRAGMETRPYGANPL